MQIYLYQNEQQIGPFDETQIRGMVASGTISQTDIGWHEGIPEWQPLNTILAFAAPIAIPSTFAPTSVKVKAQVADKEQVVQTNVKQGAIIGGWVCFGLGIVTMYLSMWTFVIYAPLFFVAFVLSIVAMSQRRVLGGVALLLATLVVPTILGLVLFSTRTIKLAEKMSKEAETQKVASVSQDTGRKKAASEPVSGQPVPSGSKDASGSAEDKTQPEASKPVPAAKSKHPDLDAKMGFRTYKLGTPFSEFNSNDLRSAETYVKTDLRAYFVKSFDKKLGAAEIEGIQLNFLQDILQSVMVHVKGEQSTLALKEVLIAAYGQPDQTTNFMSKDLLWIGDDCKVTLAYELMGDASADFSSKSVDEKIKAITEEKAKSGAADGAKSL